MSRPHRLCYYVYDADSTTYSFSYKQFGGICNCVRVFSKRAAFKWVHRIFAAGSERVAVVQTQCYARRKTDYVGGRNGVTRFYTPEAEEKGVLGSCNSKVITEHCE